MCEKNQSLGVPQHTRTPKAREGEEIRLICKTIINIKIGEEWGHSSVILSAQLARARPKVLLITSKKLKKKQLQEKAVILWL